jgi:hypothetical protein
MHRLLELDRMTESTSIRRRDGSICVLETVEE